MRNRAASILAWTGLGSVGLMAAWTLWVWVFYKGIGWTRRFASVLVNNEATINGIRNYTAEVGAGMTSSSVIAIGITLLLGWMLFRVAGLTRTVWMGALTLAPIAALLYFRFAPDCDFVNSLGDCYGYDVDIYWPWLALGLQAAIGAILLAVAAYGRRSLSMAAATLGTGAIAALLTLQGITYR